MALGKTIILYSHPERPIFAVNHLSDRAFHHGFRILNPEYRTSNHDLAEGEKELVEFLNTLDSAEEFEGLYIPNHQITPKQREQLRNPGFDRSTVPVVY